MSDNTPIIELKEVEVTFTSRTGSLFKPNKVHDRERHVWPADADRRPGVLQRQGGHEA